jgi:hypothetical protein
VLDSIRPARPLLALLLCACPASPATSETSADLRNQPTRGPEFVLAPEQGEVVDIVLRERERAESEGRRLLVYVGASWCEPCMYFHAAVDEHRLDDVFPDLRLLEFDLDRDRDRLAAAGYVSRMIPLFVVPGPDGRAGPRRSEGGIKGPATVDMLRARIEAILRAAETDGS